MKAVFGVVSLLVALAIVGLVMVKQMKAIATVPPAAGLAAAVPPAGGTVREQSQQVQGKVAKDVAAALEQGAAARSDAIDK